MWQLEIAMFFALSVVTGIEIYSILFCALVEVNWTSCYY